MLKGKAYCPGWDTTRYPGVEHTRETFTLTASSPEATFRFAVAQDALPQGPFKWELVAVNGQGREWTTPVYLRILQPGDENLLQAVNRWRALVGVPPRRRRRTWNGASSAGSTGGTRTKNLRNPDYPHTTDPNKPYWTHRRRQVCPDEPKLHPLAFAFTRRNPSLQTLPPKE